MTDDLVTRLRMWERCGTHTNPFGMESVFMSIDAKEAADEIERLRAELAKFAQGVKIRIPTDTMEQEFQTHYRRGHEAGKAERSRMGVEISNLRDEISQLQTERDTMENRAAEAVVIAAERQAERDALAAVLRELVACDDEADLLRKDRLYGKPHLPDHKARELDHRQRSIEAWRNARRVVEGADAALREGK